VSTNLILESLVLTLTLTEALC